LTLTFSAPYQRASVLKHPRTDNRLVETATPVVVTTVVEETARLVVTSSRPDHVRASSPDEEKNKQPPDFRQGAVLV
jgi:hypothetical protein